MARADIIDTAYALRREGVELWNQKDGRFPSFLILRPSQRLIANATQIVGRINRRHRDGLCTRVGNCTVMLVLGEPLLKESLDIYAVYEGEDNLETAQRNS